MNYYGNDYKAINETINPFPGYSSYLNNDFRPLYNGNISSMVSTNRMFENPVLYKDSATLLFNYKYDQLNRITGMEAFNKFKRNTNSCDSLTKLKQFQERVKYDPNGNILRYDRHGNGTITLMDSLYYDYYAGTNRLRRVRDSVLDANRYGANASDKIVDIDHQVDADNYIYDSIGNLIQDKAEKINSIAWNVYGKITGISRGAGVQVPASEIRYTYDAAGNRISKSVEKGGNKSITWYVRDAQGNVMATYSSESPSATPLSGFALDQSERYIYGSSRLGVVTNTQPVDNANAGPKKVVDTGGMFFRGLRMYELSNHLGNVLVTISDKKRGVADPLNAALIKFFEPVMLSGTDYYPFGMAMRVGGINKYKYGFNGKENDNEVKGGDGNQIAYEARIYDPRIGVWLSTDPLQKKYPGESPYSYSGNNPIYFVDPDGQDRITTHIYINQKTGKKVVMEITTYGDTFVDRSVNAFQFVDQLKHGLDNRSSNWFLN